MSKVIRVLKHSESGKSAFCRVSTKVPGTPFTSEHGIGYLYVEEGADLPEVGFEFEYSGDISYDNMVDVESGEIRTTKDGVPLQRIVLK